jgi:glycosyltransferase involved in cell wall biosynthesis
MSKSLIRPQEPRPVISALIWNKNHGAYLEEAIMSVLAQQYQDFEIIVGDGASGDCSIDI